MTHHVILHRASMLDGKAGRTSQLVLQPDIVWRLSHRVQVWSRALLYQSIPPHILHVHSFRVPDMRFEPHLLL